MTKANAVLAAAVVLFGSGCFVLFRDLGIERNRVQTLEAQLAQLQSDSKAPEPTPVGDETVLSGELPAQIVTAIPAASSTSAPSAPAISKPVAAKPRSELDQWRRMLADPAYREAMLTQHRLQLEPQYAELAAELGLSQEEADRFLDLLAEQSLRESEYRMKDSLAANSENGEARRSRLQEGYEQAEKERKAFLGEERFRTWTEYVNSTGARAQVRELRTQLATSSSPLREDQIKPLVKALAAEQQRHSAEREQNRSGVEWTNETPAAEQIAYMERRARLIEESLERSREEAAAYLDSEQQRRFDEMLDRQRERARAELELWRASLEAEKRGRAGAASAR